MSGNRSYNAKRYKLLLPLRLLRMLLQLQGLQRVLKLQYSAAPCEGNVVTKRLCDTHSNGGLTSTRLASKQNRTPSNLTAGREGVGVGPMQAPGVCARVQVRACHQHSTVSNTD
jgi:hypothetical protein